MRKAAAVSKLHITCRRRIKAPQARPLRLHFDVCQLIVLQVDHLKIDLVVVVLRDQSRG